MSINSIENIHILQSGIQKSGNLFLYNILDHIFRVKRVEKKSLIKEYSKYSVSHSFQNADRIYPFDVLSFDGTGLPKFKIYRNSHIEIDDLSSFAKSNNHAWTHSFLDERYLNDLTAFDKIIYIIRDPRDRAISNSHWVFSKTRSKDLGSPHLADDQKDYLKKHYLKDIIEWGMHLVNHINASKRIPIYFVFYENLVHNFDEELERMASFLKISLSKNEIKKISENVNFTSMSKKDPEHVRKGGYYGWMDDLSAFQSGLALFTVGKILKELNYPLKKKQHSLPNADWLKKEINFNSYLRRVKILDRIYLLLKRLYKGLK